MSERLENLLEEFGGEGLEGGNEVFLREQLAYLNRQLAHLNSQAAAIEAQQSRVESELRQTSKRLQAIGAEQTKAHLDSEHRTAGRKKAY